MRPINSLVHSRTRLTPRYALFPLEGYPPSRLPTWPTAQVRVLASPRIGAGFVQYLIDLPGGERGHFAADPEIETFFYVLTGKGTFIDRDGFEMPIEPGAFGLTPPGRPSRFEAAEATQLLILRKKYEPAKGFERGAQFFGHEREIEKTVWAGDAGALLQTLIPDEFKFDLAMNIFTFAPGHGLPIVETHVMEHGALILGGKGVYHLNGDWIEVEKDDFIWMGPYCPQSFYATGPNPARYLYYKNVNREIAL